MCDRSKRNHFWPILILGFSYRNQCLECMELGFKHFTLAYWIGFSAWKLESIQAYRIQCLECMELGFSYRNQCLECMELGFKHLTLAWTGTSIIHCLECMNLVTKRFGYEAKKFGYEAKKWSTKTGQLKKSGQIFWHFLTTNLLEFWPRQVNYNKTGHVPKRKSLGTWPVVTK